jgi:hypothetical protein
VGGRKKKGKRSGVAVVFGVAVGWWPVVKRLSLLWSLLIVTMLAKGWMSRTVTDCVDMVRSWAMKAVRVSEKLENNN